jgi:hypothetical protein
MHDSLFFRSSSLSVLLATVYVQLSVAGLAMTDEMRCVRVMAGVSLNPTNW